MSNNWKEIWSKRTGDKDLDIEALKLNPREMFIYMKKLNGFDIIEDGISYEAFTEQHDRLTERLCLKKPCESVFEVGCGSGGNLYLFSLLGFKVGGIDYSQGLLDFAGRAIDENRIAELVCDEALNVSTEIKYDGVFSNSVFSYFDDYEYAEGVLTKMCEKCRNSIVLVDVHDLDKKEVFIDHRRKTIENYDEKYKGLSKLFYPKSFFEDFGQKNKMEVVFYKSEVEGYWNNPYVYNVCFYK